MRPTVCEWALSQHAEPTSAVIASKCCTWPHHGSSATENVQRVPKCRNHNDGTAVNVCHNGGRVAREITVPFKPRCRRCDLHEGMLASQRSDLCIWSSANQAWRLRRVTAVPVVTRETKISD